MNDTDITYEDISSDEITKEDMTNIFSYDEKNIYRIIKNIRYETRTYWIDCGNHAGTEEETFEHEVYFTSEELIRYYIEHINLINFTRHNQHDDIMIAGKFYKKLMNYKIKQIIQTKRAK